MTVHSCCFYWRKDILRLPVAIFAQTSPFLYFPIFLSDTLIYCVRLLHTSMYTYMLCARLHRIEFSLSPLHREETRMRFTIVNPLVLPFSFSSAHLTIQICRQNHSVSIHAYRILHRSRRRKISIHAIAESLAGENGNYSGNEESTRYNRRQKDNSAPSQYCKHLRYRIVSVESDCVDQRLKIHF